jgi:hypothetical protein
MNRRTVIRNVVIITAGASFLPACHTAGETPSLTLKNIPLTGLQEKMLAELAETIIPKTSNFIGAKDLKSHEFALIMMNDCASPEDQKVFADGMKAFEDGCQKKFNSSFTKCNADQRKDWLKELETSKDEKDPVIGGASKFYKTIKNYTIQSFTSSQQYLQDVVKWKMVPGPVFKGCVAV